MVPAPVTRARVTTWARWVLAPLAILLLAWLGGHITTPGLGIAVWWPAVGVSTWFALSAPWRGRAAALVLIALATCGANMIIGRPLPMSLSYGLINGIEVALLLLLLRTPGRHFTLSTRMDALRLVLSVALAAMVLGLGVAAIASTVTGRDVLASAMMSAASHFSAILLIAPFALLPPRIAQRPPVLEIVVVSVILAGAVFAAFRAGATLPLSFLVFAVLAWGALRFPVAITFVQALAVSLAVLMLTVFGVGSFASPSLTPMETAISVVTFICTVAVFTVLLVSARYETQMAARETLRAARAQADADAERAAALAARLELKRQREDLVATTSHELRTPITNIAGYAELLSDQAEEGSPAHGWSNAIERNAARLTQLVNDLLWLGAARHRLRATPQLCAVTVCEVVGTAVTSHRPLADARSITLDTAISPHLVVAADRADVGRILENLLSNALKFTPEGGRVRVSATPAAATVAITVSDTGPGMTSETIAHAFEQFYRGADASAHNASGTGLGLAIARDLAHRNDGTLTVKTGSGPGACVILTLRSAPASALHDAPIRR